MEILKTAVEIFMIMVYVILGIAGVLTGISFVKEVGELAKGPSKWQRLSMDDDDPKKVP